MTDVAASLGFLEQTDDFVGRHIGPREAEIAEMLAVVGAGSLGELIDRCAPESIRATNALDLPDSRTEVDVLAEMRDIASRNTVHRSVIGAGYYNTITPPVILRNVLENPGWYTAYTPYQPEISQGRLEALLNFQTMICDMTGMEISNASLLDEATAAAEAMTMCRRVGKSKSARFVASPECHPQTLDVLRTRAKPLGIDLVIGDPMAALNEKDGCFGVLLQYPASHGAVTDYSDVVETAHDLGAIVVVAADLLSLTLLAPPGEWGADIVVGGAQRFGVPLGFGGPHAAFLATREQYKRSIPGRLVGVSVDSRGRPALRLALQTREQHIRREKATSNICTAQVLLAVMAGLYAVYHGPDRLRIMAQRVHRLTVIFAEGLSQAGLAPRNETYFDTVAIPVQNVDEVHARARSAGYNLREIDEDTVGVSFDETTMRADVEALWAVFGVGASLDLSVEALDASASTKIPESLRRQSLFLTHPVFHSHHSETEMLRYLRRLQEKDIALDRSMIPLGSCTMKLNATVEMIPVTWPEFSNIHPFAPLDQAQGYLDLTRDLEDWLCRITGYDAVSLQPNAGSQGEYAGLLAIRGYQAAQGEAERDICLIPSSAHGTNPASAIMAGLRVIVVDCLTDGDIDMVDLRAKAEKHRDALSALMVTYPSTHGVFEESIREVCDVIHENGGQVYLDGANLNAQVGVCRPGEYGADVSHLNLHKTFCIPHGGGGPGVGPIGVRAHLAPYLPSHGVHPRPNASGAPVAAAPWGSAGILPITWVYIALMGAPGLTKATQVAILNANYIAKRLNEHFPVLFTGAGGLVAHECIIDLRWLPKALSIDDVAKRLMDYGFHAPTMSWPVASTLMIEPTESESKVEIDRFCDAMISIRAEITKVETGAFDADDNPLRNSPHTMADLISEEWTHPYSRDLAVFPAPGLRGEKYWPPVGRIDQVYGDRHLTCACPPLEAYLEIDEAS
ncbi:MAG: aminomethyl-transferring glycine dehydrogenase [Alphaproteobacteria bacterium]|nr:aminomethyl-transferring glycine dehydrogenase [Alphaproteobacteria bacterium]